MPDPSAAATGQVPISLVLTVLNEADSLPAFFESVGAQSVYPAEIVIVDGGSTDRTLDLLHRWSPPGDTALRVLRHPGANISQGRNAAIEAAAHDYVAVTDAGTSLSHRWLECLFAVLEEGADVASGFFEPTGTAFMERAIAVTITPRIGEIDPARFLPSSRSVAFRRQTWRSAGGYPEWLDYCEDLVFDIAMLAGGAHIAFAPEAVVTWSGRPSLRAFSKQYYRYARGDGKSGLWAKRHAIRYLTYIVAAYLIVRRPRSRATYVVLGAGTPAYLQKFAKRVWSSRSTFGAATPAALAMVPAIVVTGDVAKMLGYPSGLWWRWRRSRRP